MLGEIGHISIAVEGLNASVALYHRVGMREHRETVEEFGVEAALLEIGDASKR